MISNTNWKDNRSEANDGISERKTLLTVKLERQIANTRLLNLEAETACKSIEQTKTINHDNGCR
jgi:hypothetical protein